jgi:hypothetical protein
MMSIKYIGIKQKLFTKKKIGALGFKVSVSVSLPSLD